MSGDGTGENGGMTDTAPMPPCPACASEYTYESGALYACPMLPTSGLPAIAGTPMPTVGEW